jgi:hypothetical protein
MGHSARLYERQEMTLRELISVLDRVLDLIERVKTGHEFLHSDDVLQKLQWTAKNLADEIWTAQLREANQ